MTTTKPSPCALFQTLDAHPAALAQLQTLLHTLRNSLRPNNSRSSNSGDGVWESASPAPSPVPAPTSAENKDTRLFAETHDALVGWLAASPSASSSQPNKTLPLATWLLCMEIGACVLVAQQHQNVVPSDQLQLLLKSAIVPIELPSSSAHCDVQQQLAFSSSVWDALVARALPAIDTSAQGSERVLSQLVDVFAHWIGGSMRGYEAAFISNVGSALMAHIAQSVAADKNPARARICEAASLNLLKSKATSNWQTSAPQVAVAVLVLRATCSATAESERELEQLRLLVGSRLKSDPFPHVHDPHSVLAMALGVMTSNSSNNKEQAPVNNNQQTTWAQVVVQQLALLRSVNLSLLSFRLNNNNQQQQQQQELNSSLLLLQQNLSSAMRASGDASMVALSFQMLEKCVVEATSFFRSSSVSTSYAPLVKALQSVYPPGLLRDAVISSYLDSKSDAKTPVEEADTKAIVGYLKALYQTVSSVLQTLTASQPGNVNALLLAFLTLSKLEFARESCSSADTNAFMNQLTQQLEDAMESSPNHVLSTLLRAVAVPNGSPSSSENHNGTWPTKSSAVALSTASTATPNSVLPLEVDVIYGAQALVVGVILQRKLRVLLFQSTPTLVGDALALVFSGLYSGYEPLNLFAHNFLGFCLTHLGQYISIYSIAPHYLQVTLAKYPIGAAAQDSLAKTCGVIFGALFFAAQPETSNSGSSSSVATVTMTQQQRMVLWAMKQCCDRVAELVLAPQPTISHVAEPVGDDNVENGKTAASQEPLAGDSMKSGLYLAGIIFEVMKMGPIELLVQIAMEVELLLSKCCAETSKSALHALKMQLFASISQNCDAEKRAWLAAWYIEIAALYPTAEDHEPLKEQSTSEAAVQSRL